MSSTPFWDLVTDAQGNVTTPGVEGALNQTNAWDACVLQGIHMPGLVSVQVVEKKRRVQNKKQNGSDGATPTFRGLDPAKVTIRVGIWTPDQLRLMDSLLPVIFPNPNKDVNKLSALDISHPVTNQRGIKSIIIEDYEGPNDTGTKGVKEYVFKCWEYLPVKAKTQVKSPASAVAVTRSFQPNTKNAPKPPSATDFGPTLQSTPQQGGT